jgi:integrase
MSAKRIKERIAGRHFVWLVGQRDGVYVADGRSNKLNAGRHSLGTKIYKDAITALQRLDLVRAVALGLAHPSVLEPDADQVALDDGRRQYEAHVRRPRVVGGAKLSTNKRYRAVFDKFVAFAMKEGIFTWNQVTTKVLETYAAFLDDEGYAYATEYLELTTLKQTVKHFVTTGLLPAKNLISLPLVKPQGTTTYCWRRNEVTAILEQCRSEPDLRWLEYVIVALACTGLRISELASIRWTDIDRAANMIRLTDESSQARRRNGRKPRETKSGRSRAFPIHEDLVRVLDQLKPHADGLVFHGPLGGKLKPDTVRNVLIRDVLTCLKDRFPAAAGEVGFADGRLHSFRHYFCSTCANRSVPEQVVMEWLGHRDSKMVRHYYHLHDDEAQRQMRRLDFLGNGAGGVAGDHDGNFVGGPRGELERVDVYETGDGS